MVETTWFNQGCAFLLEARAKELLGVARRESKRKRVPAAQQCVRGVVLTHNSQIYWLECGTNTRSVTLNRPEAVVIYA